MKHWLWRAGICGILLVGLCCGQWVSPSHLTQACTAPAQGLPPYDLGKHVGMAQTIVVGTVATRYHEPTDSPYETAEITVSQYLKGSGGAHLRVSGFGFGGLCLAEVPPPQPTIFFLRQNAGGWELVYFTQFLAYIAADSNNLQSITAFTGEAPLAPQQDSNPATVTPILPLPITHQPSVTPANAGGIFDAGVLGGFLCLGMASFLLFGAVATAWVVWWQGETPRRVRVERHIGDTEPKR
ncbi:MAG TPA: hypothetical protein PK299_06065 [Anaerolineales bacterium]|nr:hypothetical protein [Anaerolineales bacterium]